VSGVPLTTGRSVAAAIPDGNRLLLTLDDGSQRCADHVLLATGYRPAVVRYPFLTGSLVSAVRQHDGYPELGAGFESSVPGLHFIGASAAMSYGPVMRFVSGTGYTARALTRRVVGEGFSPGAIFRQARVSVGLEGS